MCEALPVGMLARLSALGVELVQWAQQHRDAPLAEQETAVLAAVRAALPDLLGAVVRLTTRALDPGVRGVRQRCPRCGRRTRVDSWRPRQVRTICGHMTFTRAWYRCRACHHGFAPADTTLGLPARARLSGGLQAWVVRLGATTTYREAADLLRTLTGLEAAPDTVRARTTVCGTAVEAAQQAAIMRVQTIRAAGEPVEPAPGTLVVEADGVMVRYQDGWHEVKVGVVGGTADAGTLTAMSYVAAREAAEAFGPRLLAEAARRGALDIVRWAGDITGRGLAVLRSVHVLGDGAPWIWNLADDHFGERTEAVDYYHATEHVWTVARALYPDAAAAAAWAEARTQDLYDGGAAPVRTALRKARATTDAAAEVLRVERGYFKTNAARMAYPQLRAQGLPIGSGAVEASAGHLVQQRCKRRGQRWSVTGATAVLAVRSCYASGRDPFQVAKRPP